MTRSARIRTVIGVVAALAIVCALPAVASAAPGQIDPAFGHAGNGTILETGRETDLLDKVLHQPDGKTVTISSSLAADDATTTITVRRYLTSGALDPSFHQTGIASDVLAGEFGGGALQPDGKIIVVGAHDLSTGFFVVRLRADGTIDPTFVTAHPTTTFATGAINQARAVVIGLGGTIVVAGRADNKAGIACFTATGALDPTFSGDGRAAFDFGGQDAVNDLAVLPDGRVIIVGGDDSSDSAARVVVARISVNGTRDATFGTGGRVDPTKTPIADATALVLQGNKPVVAGVAHDETSALTRYTASGTVDLSFGTAGTTRTQPGRRAQIQALTADGAGRLVAVGSLSVSLTSISDYTAVLRFSHDGVPDNTFGCSGSTLTEVLGVGNDNENDSSIARGVAADSSTIVVAGFALALDPIAGGTASNFVARFRGDGTHTPGYALLRRDGGTSAFGGAPACGSAKSFATGARAVGVAYDPVAPGNWTVASDGGIFTFGAARFFGSTGAIKLNQPIVGMAAAPDGKGYWLAARDGGIFAFGSARFFGSTGAIHLNKPIVGMAAARDGKGYFLVASDGGVFAFGSAKFKGSTGSLRLNKPIVGMAADPDGTGYWLVASDGGIFAFASKFSGSTGNIKLNQPIVGIAADPDGTGYWMAARDGGIFAFAAEYSGSTASTPFPVGSVRSTIGIAATP